LCIMTGIWTGFWAASEGGATEDSCHPHRLSVILTVLLVVTISTRFGR
jgi:hypothetical protein